MRKGWRLLAILCCLLAAPCLGQPPATAPGLMHATPYRPGLVVADYRVSEKLDGVRGRWDGQALWTRGGHRIAAPAWFTAGWPAEPLDGELWLGRGRFDETSALIRRAAPDDPGWRALRFMVFDLPQHPGGFEARWQRLRALLSSTAVAWLQPVAQRRLADADALEAALREVVDGGGEGLMLHHRDAVYRAGRSDGLLKLKPFSDAEARVVGHTPGRGRFTGMLGALVVERPDGLRFRLGSGLDHATRADPPPIGSQVTYRYSGYTARGVPRFARYLRPRHDDGPSPPR